MQSAISSGVRDRGLGTRISACSSSPRKRTIENSVSTRPASIADLDRAAEQVLAEGVGEAAHGELRGDVGGAARWTPGGRRSSRCRHDRRRGRTAGRGESRASAHHCPSLSTARSSSSVLASNGSRPSARPAPFTRMSTPPASATARSTNRSQPAGSVTSTSSATSASIRPVRRVPPATRTPSRRSAATVAAPIPLDAPVTTAVLPASDATVADSTGAVRYCSARSDALDRHVLARPVALVARAVRDTVDDVHPHRDAPEDGVLAVEPRTLRGGDDEELAAVRVRPGIRHRERAAVTLYSLNSSSNLYPGPPEPVPVGSPPWIMKSGITRWKTTPS